MMLACLQTSLNDDNHSRAAVGAYYDSAAAAAAAAARSIVDERRVSSTNISSHQAAYTTFTHLSYSSLTAIRSELWQSPTSSSKAAQQCIFILNLNISPKT